MPAAGAKPTAKKTSKKSMVKFTVDCWQPVEDKVFDVNAFSQFLKDHIKVNNKTGNLGTKVEVTNEKAKVTVSAELPFSKRYLKYLTKKYLKKSQLRDFLHVIASSKGTYELKYFKVSGGSGDAEEEK